MANVSRELASLHEQNRALTQAGRHAEAAVGYTRLSRALQECGENVGAVTNSRLASSALMKSNQPERAKGEVAWALQLCKAR